MHLCHTRSRVPSRGRSLASLTWFLSRPIDFSHAVGDRDRRQDFKRRRLAIFWSHRCQIWARDDLQGFNFLKYLYFDFSNENKPLKKFVVFCCPALYNGVYSRRVAYLTCSQLVAYLACSRRPTYLTYSRRLTYITYSRRTTYSRCVHLSSTEDLQ